MESSEFCMVLFVSDVTDPRAKHKKQTKLKFPSRPLGTEQVARSGPSVGFPKTCYKRNIGDACLFLPVVSPTKDFFVSKKIWKPY